MYKDPTEFRKRFAAWKDGKKPYKAGIPYDDDNHNLEYDYARAAELGYQHDKTGHYPTRDYETDRYLKSPAHPTVMKSVISDLGEGYIPYYNNGQLYSDTWMKPYKKEDVPTPYRYKDGKLPGYAIGTPDNEEVSDATYVLRPMIVRPIKRNFIAEAQKRHAAEAVGPDTRSSYQRKQSLDAKLYANQQYQKAKDDAKRAEGMELMMKTISPSTYIEAATGLDLGTVGRFVTDAAVFGLPGVLKHGISKVLSTPILGKWVYNIPEDANMAYRIMGPLERDWLMLGNELSTRATNIATEAEAAAARTKGRINLFKAGAEHGGRKQFSKGQPWHANTTTHGEKQILAIPGEDLPWVSGKHYRGPQGNGWGAGEISFDEAPFGSHIDLLTDETGFSGINPSLLPGSVIYSPFHIFGKKLGYKVLYPKRIGSPYNYGINKYAE